MMRLVFISCRVVRVSMVVAAVTLIASIGHAALADQPAPVDQVTQASPVVDDGAPSPGAPGSELVELNRQLDQLDGDAIWERRRLVKQIDDLRIAQATAGKIDYRKLTYRSSDGLMIPAYLFKPLRLRADKMPAVIYAHGGQHGWFRFSTLRHVEALVARGYIVLAPDYRGSAGYTQEFYAAADYGGLEIDDMLAARDFLTNLPEVDSRKIAIMGQSHGGYNSLMALARAPGKFAAAIDFFGPTDLVWRLTATRDENPNAGSNDHEEFTRMVGKSIEVAPELYRARSPRYLAGQILEPLLILHGDEDTVVLLQESQWLAAALEEAGKQNFAFHIIPGGKHGYPDSAWGPGWQLTYDFLQQVFSQIDGTSLP